MMGFRAESSLRSRDHIKHQTKGQIKRESPPRPHHSGAQGYDAYCAKELCACNTDSTLPARSPQLRCPRADAA